MSDKTMDDIKSGKGLPPLPGNSDSNNIPGITTEGIEMKSTRFEHIHKCYELNTINGLAQLMVKLLKTGGPCWKCGRRAQCNSRDRKSRKKCVEGVEEYLREEWPGMGDI